MITVDAELEAELRARRARLEERRRRGQGGERSVAAEVVVARRGGARLGLDIEHIAEFRRTPVTPLPGAPAAITGLFQTRGTTHCCVDLLTLLTGERPSLDERELLIGVIHTPAGPLGLRFDEVLGPRTVYADEVDGSRRPEEHSVVSLVTRDLLQIIDHRRLCDAPEIRVGKG